MGLHIRFMWLERGYRSFNSDEVVKCEFIKGLVKSGHWWASEWVGEPYNVVQQKSFWLHGLLYEILGCHDSMFPVLGLLTNVFIFVLWAWVLVKRTGQLRSSLPVLAALAIPPPAVESLGFNLCEIRMSMIYGALITAYAGEWLRTPRRTFLFGLVGSLGCWEDLFTFFFLAASLPLEIRAQGGWRGALRFWWAFLTGVLMGLLAGWFLYRGLPYFPQANYMLGGLATFQQGLIHLRILMEMWPLHWIGALPFGWLQQSSLGRWLDPGWKVGSPLLLSALFWLMLAGTAYGFARMVHREWKRWYEDVFLWVFPPLSLLVFFILSSQVFGVLSLRYLQPLLLFPFALLGLWAASSSGRLGWIMVLTIWLSFHGVALFLGFSSPRPIHPAQWMANRLEKMGVSAGYADFWISESVRYISKDRVLLTAYNYRSFDDQAERAARVQREVSLVCVHGVGSSEMFEEMNRRLLLGGYRQAGVSDFKDEGWFVIHYVQAHQRE